ncbi:MAG: hypothetical protein V4632_10100 [Pseudomonadota bacterium]
MNIFLSILKNLPAVVLATFALLAWAQAPTRVTNGMLTDVTGITLYTYDRDIPGSGKSTCTGTCAADWMPLISIDGISVQGDYSIVDRDDVTRQWAYKGKPLYYWYKDKKPGDKNGDGMGEAWRVAKP